MSIPVAAEKKLLAPEDFEAVKVTHHPAIEEMSLEALQTAKRELGERREKLRMILLESRKARVRRTAREASSQDDESQVGRRKQVFAKALRRVNHELERRRDAEARAHPQAEQARAEPKPRKAKASIGASARKESAAEKPARAGKKASEAKPSEGKANESKGGSKKRKAVAPEQEG